MLWVKLNNVCSYLNNKIKLSENRSIFVIFEKENQIVKVPPHITVWVKSVFAIIFPPKLHGIVFMCVPLNSVNKIRI